MPLDFLRNSNLNLPPEHVSHFIHFPLIKQPRVKFYRRSDDIIVHYVQDAHQDVELVRLVSLEYAGDL